MSSLASSRRFKPRLGLQAALFGVIALVALLLLGVGPAFAAEEGGSTPTDPIVVPEVETPTTNPTTPPAEPSTGGSGGSSSPAPTSPSTGSTTTSTTTTHTSTPTGSGGTGGSKTAPTQVNHGISGGSGGSGGASPAGGGNGGGGGGQTTSAGPTGSSPTITTTEADGSAESADSAATTTGIGGVATKAKKPQHEQPAAQPDPAPETGSLSDADAVSKPDKQAPFWAPLGGKNSLPYKILILMIVVVGLAILFLQFTNPQRLRYYRARLFGMPEASIPVRPKRRPAMAARPRRLRTAERAAQPSSLASRRAQRRKAA